ncbi:MAG: ATP-binding protein [Candidatus Helarchaeota archaeon]
MNKIELRDSYFHVMYRLYLLLMRQCELYEIIENCEVRRISKKTKKHSDAERELRYSYRKIARQEKKLAALSCGAEKTKSSISIEKLAKDYALNRDEKLIIIILLCALLREHSFRSCVRGAELLRFLGYRPHEFVKKGILLTKAGNLRRHDLIKAKRYDDDSIFDTRFELTLKALKCIFGNEIVSDLSTDFDEDATCILTVRDPVVTFDQLVLEPQMRASIIKVVTQIEKVRRHLKEWHLDRIIKYGKAASMLFYGPPGTGKTATCEAIAQRLGKRIGIANYAQIVNQWFGNSEKNIVRVFKEAKRHNCVLVFDEADSLFGKRLTDEDGGNRTYNIMTNLLMQQMELFDGTIILTTNREFVLDSAFERRILLKVNFGVPNPRDRAKIWRMHFTDCVPLAKDVDFDELGKRFDFTGGNIKNVVLKAVYECAYSGKPISMDDLIFLASEEARGYGKKKVGFDK